MSKLHPVPPEFAAKARIRADDYARLYAESVRDSAGFWRKVAQRLDWMRPFSKVRDVSFAADNLHIRWFEDGQLNLSANCLDRHLGTSTANKAALIWEGEPGEIRTFTYKQLHREVCLFANVLSFRYISFETAEDGALLSELEGSPSRNRLYVAGKLPRPRTRVLRMPKRVRVDQSAVGGDRQLDSTGAYLYATSVNSTRPNGFRR